MKGSGSFIRNLSVLLVVASFGSCHKDIENVDRPIIQNKLLVASEYGHRHNEILTQLLANEAIASIDTMTLSTALQILDTTVAIYWRLGYTQDWDSLASAQNLLVNRITNELCYNDDVFYVIDSALLLIDYIENSIGLSSTFAETFGLASIILADQLSAATERQLSIKNN